RMSSIYEIKMLTMIILYTECLIQRTKLGYDSTPFNHKDTPTAEIYTLSLHDALPILGGPATHLTAETAVAHCDENTIGVVAILGSTFDGAYEPVLGIAKALDALAAGGGPDVPIHVDAASGGFVAPFIDPDLLWDFRLPRVVSINASAHKYGLVYPGIGWVVWRDASRLPDELVFKVDYPGGEMPTFSLNFSRPGSQVAAQYY